MYFQSLGSRQISDTMSELNLSATQMTGSLSQFKAVTDDLTEAANRLDEAVSRFVV